MYYLFDSDRDNIFNYQNYCPTLFKLKKKKKKKSGIRLIKEGKIKSAKNLPVSHLKNYEYSSCFCVGMMYFSSLRLERNWPKDWGTKSIIIEGHYMNLTNYIDQRVAVSEGKRRDSGILTIKLKAIATLHWHKS